ncbi:group II intron maturase-specific domain-containing protein [Photorhabdus thracensis]|uniref:group II intron maturase-specific domain-containing protein n=1 Tax=Photorhabdus thracensis TaxID=230089 RepID=UPI003981D37A
MVECVRSVFLPCRTGSPRRLLSRFSNLCWNRCSIRPRLSKNRWGKTFVNFSPAIRARAGKAIRQEVRSWKLQNRSDKSLSDLAHMFNAKIRGWVNYYGAFYKSALYPTLRQIDRKLVLWLTRKHKRLRGHRRRASHWLARVARKETKLFAHWEHLNRNLRFSY